MVRLLPFFAATTLFLTGCSYFQAVPPDQHRAIVVSFDGAGERVIERMLDHGVMPNMARLRAEGAMADYSRTNFPSKTAAGHAALWTGTFGNVNGITSNKVPPLPWGEHSITEVKDGFSSESLLAEPLFVTAARAGKRALVLQATHGAPFAPYQPGGRFGDGLRGSLTVLDGYVGVRGKDGVIHTPKAFRPASGWTTAIPASVRPAQEAELKIADSTFWALAVDNPADGVQGYDTLRLYASKGGNPVATLRPTATRLPEPGNQAVTDPADAWSEPVPVNTPKGPARVHVRLFDLDPKLDHWLLYHSPPALGQSNKPEVAARYYEDAEFWPGAAIDAWREGHFGKTMFQGGDGTAEDRYLDTVAYLFETNRRRTRLALEAKDWDLLVTYVPFPDEALHAWYGAVDDQSPTYDPQLAPVVWRRLESVCRLVDGYLGELMAHAGRETAVAVASDHGMAGLSHKFRPNVILKQAGLLHTDGEDYVELAKTQVLYAPTDGGYLLVNRVGRKGGIVPESQVEQVLAKAQAALAAVKGPDGQPVVTRFFRPSAENRDLGLGGDRGGDLYLDLRPGYYFDSHWGDKPAFEKLDPGSAGHIFDPRRPDMHAIQGYWGAGVKRGQALPAVRNSDLAPTVCRLLGIPAPAQATGRVVTEALE